MLSMTQYNGMRRVNVSCEAVKPCSIKASFGNFEIVAKHSTTAERRKKRHYHIRKKVSGTPEKPRLAVFRSNDHIYAQVIDDTIGHTLAYASTLIKEIKEQTDGKGNDKNAAFIVGKNVGSKCIEQGIMKVCFDRAGFKFHGRVKAVAEGAREAGLQF